LDVLYPVSCYSGVWEAEFLGEGVSCEVSGEESDFVFYCCHVFLLVWVLPFPVGKGIRFSSDVGFGFLQFCFDVVEGCGAHFDDVVDGAVLFLIA